MKAMHQVILSLGSNQGNRLEILEKCVLELDFLLGKIEKISSVYETPAWGFESAAFYNCALLLQTNKNPQEVLSLILSLEKKLGRTRNTEKSYQARVIDIDIIAFDDEIIIEENLQIPHPLLQNRNFVLVPFQEILPNWEHPVMNLSIENLLKISPDGSICKLVNVLHPPKKINFGNKYIVIDGNIGAGKTTLATKLSKDAAAITILERFADNLFLPLFYQNKERYAFALEIAFLLDRIEQFNQDIATITFDKNVVIADYHISKCLLFAEITLTTEEFLLYKKTFHLLNNTTKKPDLYVFLKQNSDTLLQNIQKRGRDFELEISKSYLDEINNSYATFIKSQKAFPILTLDVTGRDFVNNQADYTWVVAQIKAKLLSI